MIEKMAELIRSQKAIYQNQSGPGRVLIRPFSHSVISLLYTEHLVCTILSLVPMMSIVHN